MVKEVMMLDNQKIKELIKEHKLKDMGDVNTLLKQFSKKLLENMLESELTDHLGYEKHHVAAKKGNNSRNGHSKKCVNSDFGEIDLKIPRDRSDDFSPIIVKKGQRTISGLDEKVLMMYSRGMSERDISDFIEDTYKYKLSAQTISNIISNISEEVSTWQNRPLQSFYVALFLDAIVYKVKQDGIIKNMAVYSMIGVDLSGRREVLGLWAGNNESSKYWLKLLNEIKSRGVEDVLVVCVDGLKGFSEAIAAVYPDADVQRCIVHQVRNSLRFVSWKDRKELAGDLKLIYRATSEESARIELDNFSEKWDKHYEYISKSWRDNWTELMSFFNYPNEIRRVIYTTNSIENFHRSLRKITKSKPVFPNDKSLMRLLYLITKNVTVKWTQKVQNWGLIYSQLRITFDDRIEKYV
jgi:transposase-like protein